MPVYDYIIGTGWWCKGSEPRIEGRFYVGSDIIRTAEFHHLWSVAVDTYTSAQTVFIVDSASNQKPPITNARYQMMSLMKNPGHPQLHAGHYSGWTASVIHSLEYALSNDVDYLVYIEQDALIFGDGIVEHCISRMRKPFMFGSGKGTPQPLQQSFFIIRNDGIKKFLSRLHAIVNRDNIISPEWKFLLASLGISGRLLEFPFTHKRLSSRIFHYFGELMQTAGYDLLPFGFGRCRPLDFNHKYFYFQHGSLDEIRDYLRHGPLEMLTNLEQRSPSFASLIYDEQTNEQ